MLTFNLKQLLKTVIISGFLFGPCILKSLDLPSYALDDANRVPLDHKLAKIMNFKNGTFVEVGAHNGLFQSNTKMFEEFYGWTGILIEPSSGLFSQLCANRPKAKCFQCALGSFEEHETYAYGSFKGSPMSGFFESDKTEKVFIRSLQSILDECKFKHINLFSLDVEGYEFQILKGIDFKKTTFDYLLIEIRNHHYEAIVSFLENEGYALVGNFSNYNIKDNPHWDGTHNDYLFKNSQHIEA